MLLPAAGVILLWASASTAAEVEDAQSLYNSGKYAECLAACEEGIKRQSWRESWRHLKLRAELETGRYGDAQETLEAALERFPSSLRLRLVGAEVLRFNDRSEDAEKMLAEIETMANQQPWRFSDSGNRIALGRFFLLRGADARQILEVFFDRVKKDRPSDPESYLATGELALQKHDYALAAEAFEQAEKRSPPDPAVHFGLARAFMPSDPERAAKALVRALELNPSHPDSLLLQVDRLIDSEHYREAETLLAKVLEVNPKHPRALAYRAVLAHLEGDASREESWRKAALATWSANPEVDHLIGRKLSQHYRFAEGAACQRRALGLDPNYLPAKMQLADDLLRLGQEEEGWRLANEVYGADGYNVAAHNLVILQENFSKFKTLERDGLVLRMDAREADVFGDRVLDLLERAKGTLCGKYDVRIEHPIVVEIFPERKDFAVRTFGIPFVEGFLGVCFGNVITANSPAAQGENPSNWQAVLWHEFCHSVTLHKSGNKMPRWLSEGISVYEERQENRAWGQSMNAEYRRVVLEGGLTPVSRLSGAFLDPPSPMHLEFAYYEASLVVEYLVGKHGIETIRDILTDLSAGTSINEVLLNRVGSLDQLDEEFAKFAKKRAADFAPKADWNDPDLPPDAGLAAIADWNQRHPNNIPGLELLAAGLLEAKRWEEAKTPLEKLIELCPQNTGPQNPYGLLAKVHRTLNETEAERAVLEKLAELDSDAVDVYARLVELCAENEDWANLAICAERMLAVNPMLRNPHRHLARAAEMLDQSDRAIQSYRALLQMEPIDPVATHFRLARLLCEKGDLPTARRQVLMALEEAPRYRAAHKLLLEIVDELENAEDNGTEPDPPEADAEESP